MAAVEGPNNFSPAPHQGEARYVVNVAARDRLLAVLNGPDQEQKEYLRTRSFSLDELPEWLRKETYHVAKVEFEKTSKAAVLEDMYQTPRALKRAGCVEEFSSDRQSSTGHSRQRLLLQRLCALSRGHFPSSIL